MNNSHIHRLYRLDHFARRPVQLRLDRQRRRWVSTAKHRRRRRLTKERILHTGSSEGLKRRQYLLRSLRHHNNLRLNVSRWTVWTTAIPLFAVKVAQHLIFVHMWVKIPKMQRHKEDTIFNTPRPLILKTSASLLTYLKFFCVTRFLGGSFTQHVQRRHFRRRRVRLRLLCVTFLRVREYF